MRQWSQIFANSGIDAGLNTRHLAPHFLIENLDGILARWRSIQNFASNSRQISS